MAGKDDVVLACLEGFEEEPVGSVEVVLAALALLVCLDLCMEVLVEFGDGVLQSGWGIWGFPLALDV